MRAARSVDRDGNGRGARCGGGNMSHIETVFERLLVAAEKQTTALVESIGDPARSRVLGACLRRTIDRLERVAVLIVVRAAPRWNAAPQRAIAVKLDALHDRA